MDEEEEAFTHLVFFAEEGDESRPRETEAEQEGGDDSEPTIITVQADVHEPPETSIEVKERKYDSNKTSKTKDKMEDLGNVHPKITTKETKDCDDPEIVNACSTSRELQYKDSCSTSRELQYKDSFSTSRELQYKDSFSTSRELQYKDSFSTSRELQYKDSCSTSRELQYKDSFSTSRELQYKDSCSTSRELQYKDSFSTSRELQYKDSCSTSRELQYKETWNHISSKKIHQDDVEA
ncbi:unnamed protein product [Bemisia tabaci]|uniref:Uncharacterized protein n=1 Tax=Bemisia tabaci TaxID=7038 RepID=A0A9P0EW71_BEMTA|nr:unnamed protein product [Bemisia tabaci]